LSSNERLLLLKPNPSEAQPAEANSTTTSPVSVKESMEQQAAASDIGATLPDAATLHDHTTSSPSAHATQTFGIREPLWRELAQTCREYRDENTMRTPGTRCEQPEWREEAQARGTQFICFSSKKYKY
jgi:hypothetical protein